MPDPGSTGFTGSHLVNIGEITNSGFELMLTGLLVDKPNFLCRCLPVAGHQQERAGVLQRRPWTRSIFGSFADVQRHREGYPMGAFWAVDVERDASGEPVVTNGNVTVKSSCRWAPERSHLEPEAECDDIYMGPSIPTREVSLGDHLHPLRQPEDRDPVRLPGRPLPVVRHLLHQQPRRT